MFTPSQLNPLNQKKRPGTESTGHCGGSLFGIADVIRELHDWLTQHLCASHPFRFNETVAPPTTNIAKVSAVNDVAMVANSVWRVNRGKPLGQPADSGLFT